MSATTNAPAPPPDPTWNPLGALVIIIDEFSELLRLRPTIAEVCDTVGGRQGRALVDSHHQRLAARRGGQDGRADGPADLFHPG